MNAHKSPILQMLQHKLDAIEIRNTELAQLLCRVIPSTCPFERSINLFGHFIVYIPPLCKLNPLYNQLIKLRFRAQCYLAQHQDNTSKL
ncbi:MAG: Mo-dependent nitrogenase C-terminal domain-containing protein [Nostoc sp. ChiSLP01]|nr:Mo-dependent nitrogenase C-terminal domain-containing protein [Nostoc sp. CmiSLP01]MDZ8286547.1 Mo-dependent nitrogenase C-terminal domain-containing protein [Nostoc sp. ChiSLP01]